MVHDRIGARINSKLATSLGSLSTSLSSSRTVFSYDFNLQTASKPMANQPSLSTLVAAGNPSTSAEGSGEAGNQQKLGVADPGVGEVAKSAGSDCESTGSQPIRFDSAAKDDSSNNG